ncbi:MAG: 4-hydroxythreonine-4-phosphate dehydrogenase PdxA [Verrucomicrobia bacterium]|nr:4-hydroxythreonine-4-phosphate dehydrogenase PdxA [Cytophagales bacterium]
MEHKPVVGITLGDYNGIGPEVVLKALADKKMLNFCTPVLYGSQKILSKYRKLMALEEWSMYPIKDFSQIGYKRTNIINCWDENLEIQPGKVTPEAGNAAFVALKMATEDLKSGKLNALVTAPINKHNIQNEDFHFPGHTEFLTQTFGVGDSLMLMANENLRVGVVTGHVSLKEVVAQLTAEKITSKLEILLQSLKKDFGITKPRIAVLGLNPHAGENGLLGSEETDIIQPVIKNFRQKGNLIFGPYPADGFFGMQTYRKFDGVLAMYHDQGLIPFKTIAFESGVNFTAGLPVVRTSPDHGTAYDIAGKNQADETSMREAIFMACQILKNRIG